MFAPNSRILIVDDMMTMRKLVGKALRELGFSEITEANDGIKGWETFSTTKPGFDFIISDWMMPNATGLDLLKRIRADSRFNRTPFFLLTAETEKDQILEAMKAGVTGYIVKPFTADSLKAHLLKGAA